MDKQYDLFGSDVKRVWGALFRSAFLLAWLLLASQIAFGTTPTRRAFTSPNPKTNPYSPGAVWEFNMLQVFQWNPLQTGGVMGEITGLGKIFLKVYRYEPNAMDGRGSFLYGCYTEDSSPSAFTEKDIKSDEVPRLKFPSTPVPSTAMQQLVLADLAGKAAITPTPVNLAGSIPVVVEIILEGDQTSLTKFRIPAMGEFDFNESNFYETGKPDLLVHEAATEIGSSDVALSFDLELPMGKTPFTMEQPYLYVEDIQGEQVLTSQFMSNHAFAAGEVFTTSNVTVLSRSAYDALPPGSYKIGLKYKVLASPAAPVINDLSVTFLRKVPAGALTTYDVVQSHYGAELPVYALVGGMSAEYGVQKSLAALSAGISHTWAVRNTPNGPDLTGGGPVSVYSTPKFLENSVKKTVELYNTNLGASTPFPAVIIGSGVPAVPYLSYTMSAPFLPFHFLVSSNSLGEVEAMVNEANDSGYPCYATAGYDPSIPGEGVSWLKLLGLPEEYKQFLIQHNVQTVILIGADENGLGETGAQKIINQFGPGTDYNPGSIYVMQHGGKEGNVILRSSYRDYDAYQYYEPQSIADWESGITNTQISAFRNDIRTLTSVPRVLVIKATESVGFYDISTTLALKFYKKNENILGTNPINTVALNEYLISFPAYESIKGQLPFLYWQAVQFIPSNIDRLRGFCQDHVAETFPDINFTNLHFHINAKYDRTPMLEALIGAKFTNATMNTWQKADVWDPSDGMDSPCEVAAVDIVNNLGAVAYRNKVHSLARLTVEDLESLAGGTLPNHDVNRNGGHPEPSKSQVLYDLSNDGITVSEYQFDPNAYWQITNAPRQVELFDVSSGYPGISKGWIDGHGKKAPKRRQRLVISQFDLTNTSDEYDLRIGYKFHPKPEDGFTSYNVQLGDEQNMDCFEYVKVPHNDWLDIPTRVMERTGATLVVNGTVYDWDYNGVPGVVPFIKKNNEIKAQPQILSFKGEAAFAWNWGANKSVKLIHRPIAVPAAGTVQTLGTLFHSETAGYANAMSGMTYMTGASLYDVESLQPQWMLDYPPFNAAYLGGGGGSTGIRCFLAEPGGLTGPCERYIIETGGVAPKEEGWNDCSKLVRDDYVHRFSAVAYQQYEKTFDDVPNARTFIAIKGNKLDIGILDGELGIYPQTQMTKYSGMRNWEVSNFVQYKGYDSFLNLDGGSSTQMWMNGRGPLNEWIGYPLIADNQGPFYSRLVSSFIMVVPKLHLDQVATFRPENTQHLILNNSNMSFDYSDALDHEKDKAIVSLGPSLEKFRFDQHEAAGVVGGNFKVDNPEAQGAILFAIGEDTYYPDTEGENDVIPEFRNIAVMGIGKIPGKLRDAILTRSTNSQLNAILASNDQAAYFIKLKDGAIATYSIEQGSFKKYLNDRWHSFYYDGGVRQLYLDNATVNQVSFGAAESPFALATATHATIGAANVDGRYVTGNARLHVDNYIFITSEAAYQRFSPLEFEAIQNGLAQNLNIFVPPAPDPAYALPDKYYEQDVFVLQFEEGAGQHSFSAQSGTPGQTRFYGLNLNSGRKKERALDHELSLKGTHFEVKELAAGLQFVDNEVMTYLVPSQHFQIAAPTADTYHIKGKLPAEGKLYFISDDFNFFTSYIKVSGIQVNPSAASVIEDIAVINLNGVPYTAKLWEVNVPSSGVFTVDGFAHGPFLVGNNLEVAGPELDVVNSKIINRPGNSGTTLVGSRGGFFMVHDQPQDHYSAFSAAHQMGIDFLEFSVHRTNDDTLVLLHDEFVAKKTVYNFDPRLKVKHFNWTTPRNNVLIHFDDGTSGTFTLPALKDAMLKDRYGSQNQYKTILSLTEGINYVRDYPVPVVMNIGPSAGLDRVYRQVLDRNIENWVVFKDTVSTAHSASYLHSRYGNILQQIMYMPVIADNTANMDQTIRGFEKEMNDQRWNVVGFELHLKTDANHLPPVGYNGGVSSKQHETLKAFAQRLKSVKWVANAMIFPTDCSGGEFKEDCPPEAADKQGCANWDMRNDPDFMIDYAEADCILTDRPDMIKTYLKARGLQ